MRPALVWSWGLRRGNPGELAGGGILVVGILTSASMHCFRTTLLVVCETLDVFGFHGSWRVGDRPF